MKFVCEKCKTKYSIADEKVRRKVLRIRCKNCSNIITVREAKRPTREEASAQQQAGPAAATREKLEGGTGRQALSRAFDGAFGASRRSSPATLAPAPDPMLGALTEIDEDLEQSDDATRLSTIADGAAGGGPADDEWFLAVDGNQFGPMGFGELCSRVKRGEAGSEAFVWRDGFGDWLDLEDVPELRPFLPRHPPPPPKGKSGLHPIVSPTRGGRGAVAPAVPPLPAAPPIPSGIGSAPPPADTMAMGRGYSGDNFAPVAPGARGQARGPSPALASPMAAKAGGGAVGAPLPPQMPPAAVAAPPPPVRPDRGDSDLGPLPIFAGASEGAGALGVTGYAPGAASSIGPLPVGPQPAAAPAARTPMWMVVAGLGGAFAALCGVFLVVYSLFLDRGQHQQSPPGTHPVASAAPPTHSGAESAAPSDDSDSLAFAPMEVGRTKEATHAAKGGGHASKARAAATDDGKDGLSAKQRRLMALYGEGGDAVGGGAIPKTAGRAEPVPQRRITQAEIFDLQRANAGSLKMCYERALKRDPKLLRVKADVTVTIGDSGIVRSVQIDADNNPDLSTCVQKAIKRWAFPAIGTQSFEFPIIFRGG